MFFNKIVPIKKPLSTKNKSTPIAPNPLIILNNKFFEVGNSK